MNALQREIETFLREPANAARVDQAGRELAARLAPFSKYVTSKAQHHTADFGVVRPTRWGNPFKLANPSDDAERRLVVLAYAIEFSLRSDADRQSMLAPIRRVLGWQHRIWCYCSPRLCHGQVHVAWAMWRGPDLLVGLDLLGEEDVAAGTVMEARR